MAIRENGLSEYRSFRNTIIDAVIYKKKYMSMIVYTRKKIQKS